MRGLTLHTPGVTTLTSTRLQPSLTFDPSEAPYRVPLGPHSCGTQWVPWLHLACLQGCLSLCASGSWPHPLGEKRAEPEPLTLTGLCSILPTCDCRGCRVSFGTHALCSLPNSTGDRTLQQELSACHAEGLSTNDAVFLMLLWAQCHENTRTTPLMPRTRYFLPESHMRGCLRIQGSPL